MFLKIALRADGEMQRPWLHFPCVGEVVSRSSLELGERLSHSEDRVRSRAGAAAGAEGKSQPDECE